MAFVFHAAGTGPVTIFGDAGTLAAFGFLLAYVRISVAAPFHLRKLGELGRRHVVIAGLAWVCLLVPTVGSFYPAPPWPINVFPYFACVHARWRFLAVHPAPQEAQAFSPPSKRISNAPSRLRPTPPR